MEDLQTEEFELILTIEGKGMSGKSYIINKIHEFLKKSGFEVEKIFGKDIKTEHQLKIKNRFRR